jgi:hypothetical protein
LKLVWPLGPRGLLRSAGKKGGSPITSICIDICCITWFYSLKCFFIANLVSEGSRFLSPGVHKTFSSIRVNRRQLNIKGKVLTVYSVPSTKVDDRPSPIIGRLLQLLTNQKRSGNTTQQQVGFSSPD